MKAAAAMAITSTAPTASPMRRPRRQRARAEDPRASVGGQHASSGGPAGSAGSARSGGWSAGPDGLMALDYRSRGGPVDDLGGGGGNDGVMLARPAQPATRPAPLNRVGPRPDAVGTARP